MAIIDGTNNAECNIVCSGTDSSNGANINCVETQIYDITCNGIDGSCRNIPTLSFISSTNKTLNYAGSNTCSADCKMI